ncbi:NUDIX hydrolase [Amycolatopsis antarctica]|uniref:NUDIX hydrolase n=1 Tax=Amycolatopsis antarctica TaxID=1854586 RepID=A0A263D6C5_9PSEU|nr:NUDIX hydrolase [Amycolatopsis antarctica]OZM74064.1 NUDIX hydrolase [Amycolatopsis antarctica]
MSRNHSPEIHAAGAVLWRSGPTGALEIAIVHRPRYDDWSLPKGKLDPGETAPVAAAREVLEETGFRAVLGRYLTRTEYRVPRRSGGGETDKAVDYFSAHVAGGRFAPNDEVDELRWVAPEQAEMLLTRRADVDVLREFRALPADLTTVLLVRHAKAGKRSEWTGDDDLRPLSEAGMRQAEALRATVTPFAPDRVLSAPRLRCVQTVQGVAEDIDADVRHEPLLSEEEYWRDPVRGVARVLAIAADGGRPVVCSQGGVIPDVVSLLAERDGVVLPARTADGEIPSKKGSLWLLAFRTGEDDAGPRLVAAGYFAALLPSAEPAQS